ncbi:uncharacterized protein [Paramormyrops kingsleyae]|uniref:uncharacterized protein isoform X2 n=1 Tax=Paramormyrops kingsleyae TaxID=1676925 RepID=UPI003B979D87
MLSSNISWLSGTRDKAPQRKLPVSVRKTTAQQPNQSLRRRYCGYARLWVQQSETVPLTEQRIETIAQQLGRHAARDPTEELRYRKALRLALNIFAKRDGQCSPEKEPLQPSSWLYAVSAQPAGREGPIGAGQPVACSSPLQPAAVPAKATGRRSRSGWLDPRCLQLQSDHETELAPSSDPQPLPEKRPRREGALGEACKASGSVSAGDDHVARRGPVVRTGRGRRAREPSGMSVGGRNSERDRRPHGDGEDISRTTSMGPLKGQAGLRGGVTARKTHTRKYRASGRRGAMPRDLSLAPPRDTLGNELLDKAPRPVLGPQETVSECPGSASGSPELETQWRAETQGCRSTRSAGEERQCLGPRSKVVVARDKARPGGRPRKAAAEMLAGDKTRPRGRPRKVAEKVAAGVKARPGSRPQTAVAEATAGDKPRPCGRPRKAATEMAAGDRARLGGCPRKAVAEAVAGDKARPRGRPRKIAAAAGDRARPGCRLRKAAEELMAGDKARPGGRPRKTAVELGARDKPRPGGRPRKAAAGLAAGNKPRPGGRPRKATAELAAADKARPGGRPRKAAGELAAGDKARPGGRPRKAAGELAAGDKARPGGRPRKAAGELAAGDKARPGGRSRKAAGELAAGDKARPGGRPRKAAGELAAGDKARPGGRPRKAAEAKARPGGRPQKATAEVTAMNPRGEEAALPSLDTLPMMRKVQLDSGSAEPLEGAVGSPTPSHSEGLAGETSWISDLSIELSLQEDPSPLKSSLLQDEGDEQEDEELPSFLLQTDKKPSAIKEGNCVWCKYRSYPYWPAVVKAINRKRKKASIIFIDPLLFETQRGLSVGMRSIKPFDCELKDQLEAEAKAEYRAVISWCLELIQDYRFRIACGSFSGSFMEYFADDISCPVRRMYAQGASDVAFPSKQIMEEQGDLVDNESEDGTLDLQSDHLFKKLLPDRSKAARNLANEKLVQFIVEKRAVEKHLQAIISGQATSKWLMALLKTSRTVDLYKTYLEDEDQVDQVYRYLQDVYKNASQTAPCLAKVDGVRLILDVLFPEAVVHAIAGVFKISLEKAEDKYLKGPSLSEREREAFDRDIEEQMTTQSVTQCPA